MNLAYRQLLDADQTSINRTQKPRVCELIVSRELYGQFSANVTKQFQKLFLENVLRDPCRLHENRYVSNDDTLYFRGRAKSGDFLCSARCIHIAESGDQLANRPAGF